MVIRSRYVEALTVLMLACLLAASGCFNFPDGPYRCASNADCDGAAGEWCDDGRCVTHEEEVVEELRLELDGEQITEAEILSEVVISVRVVTEKLEPAAGHRVTFKLEDHPQGSNDFELFFEEVDTRPDGHAETTLKLGTKTGTYTVVAEAFDEDGKVLNGSPLTIDIEAVPRTPDELERVSGDAQIGVVGQQLNDLVVLLRDDHDNPLVGQSIEITVNAPDDDISYSFVPENPITGDEGEASITFTLGTVPGRYEIIASATIDDTTLSTIFSATACESLACDAGHSCNLETGRCENTCCEDVLCGRYLVCDPDMCVQWLDDDTNPHPCTCEVDCAEGRICDLETGQCTPTCLVEGCSRFNARCNLDTGACEMRPPADGETGWPCDDESGQVSEVCDSEVCSPWGFCSESCMDHEDCEVGSFCLPGLLGDGSGFCWAACHDDWAEDCPVGMQCTDFPELAHPACFSYFDISACEDECAARGEICESSADDACADGLACVAGPDEPLGVCRQVQCRVPRDHCSGENEICHHIGANLSFCIEHCDLTNLGACPEGLSCNPSERVKSLEDIYTFVPMGEDCPPGMPISNQLGDEGKLCHEDCHAHDDCPAGLLCAGDDIQGVSVSGCVSFITILGSAQDCINGGLDGVEIHDDPQTSICFPACIEDNDCVAAGELLGACRRIAMPNDQSIKLCQYGSQGAYCDFGCSIDNDCGFCASNDDCGEFTDNDGTIRELRCDTSSSTCRRPVNEEAVATMCPDGQVRDPSGIITSGGTSRGACAKPCIDDHECEDGYCDNNFCRPHTKLCNFVSGQCEFRCSQNADCIHGVCAPTGRCVAGVCADYCSSLGDAFVCETSGTCVIGCTDNCEDPSIENCNPCPEGAGECGTNKTCEDSPCDLCYSLECDSLGQVCDLVTCACVAVD